METEKVYAICKNISHAGGKGSPQGGVCETFSVNS